MSEQREDCRPLRVEFQIHFKNGVHGSRHLKKGAVPVKPPGPTKDLPRLARLLALAHRWNRLIEEGVIANHAEIARMMGLTRARVTQITDLLYLAPDIQEAILFPSNTEKPEFNLSERAMRPITGTPTWTEQRGLWQRIRRCVTARKHE